MDLAVVGILGTIILVLLIFLFGMPVGFAMAVVGFCGFWYMVSFEAALYMAAADVWGTFSRYGLTVIPLFILMGQIAYFSGVNRKIYQTAYTWMGHVRGGLAMATIMACAGFAAICGSNAATAATMTTVALPEMKKYRYSPVLSTGAIACGSTLGVVIPPSVVLIVIGLYTGQSIAKLFYGGVAAGVLLAALFLLTVYVICRVKPGWGPAGPGFTLKEKIASLPGAFEMLLLFMLIMLGLYFGFFTPTEAGAAGAFFAMVISAFQRTLSWRGLLDSVIDTLKISCMVMMLVAGAVIFGKFLARTRIPFEIANWVAELPVSDWMVMTIIFGIYILGGAVMDALALLLITIPVFFPVALELGYDPVWFSVTITVITTLGAVTPPVGATTYVVGGLAEDVSLSTVFKGVTFFLPAYLICVAVLMLFPGLVTFLPNLVRY